jgi:hypothetical protein
MKKTVIACLFVLVGSVCFAASDDVEMYTYLYGYAQTHEDQLGLLQQMAEMNISGAGEFYADALKRLGNEYQNIRIANEKLYAENQALLLANLIGQEKYANAADDLWRVYTIISDPLVRAEILMSLGKIRSAEYLPQVILVLNNLNNNASTRDRLSGERVAYGAILSLEKYGDISGYLPVYLASKGWYNERVKTQAARSLQVISADPTDPMINVIQGAGYNFETKFGALQAVNSADVSNDSKARTAAAALAEGWSASSGDLRQLNLLTDMRKLAIQMIRENGCSDNAVYPLLDRSYIQYADMRTGGDPNEAYEVINTLSTLATENAAKSLANFLAKLNEKRKINDIQQKDEDLVRRLIPALGATKQSAGRQALNEVIILSWTDAVKRLARTALQQL